MITPKFIQFSPFFVYDPKLTAESRVKFSEDIERLPQPLKDLLLSDGTAEAIESFGKNNNISEEQTEEISKIIRDVIMAYLYIGDMPSQIAVQAGVDQAKARDIANQIVNQLFKPVLTDLKNIQKEKFGQKMASQEKIPTSGSSTMPPPPSSSVPPRLPTSPPPPSAPQTNRPPVPAQRSQDTTSQQNNPGSGPKQYNVINLKDL
ncbi:MAG: hypothetical protein Q8Q06_01815 [bacterium]|nr:hypothetical protein [bacterium]